MFSISALPNVNQYPKQNQLVAELPYAIANVTDIPVDSCQELHSQCAGDIEILGH